MEREGRPVFVVGTIDHAGAIEGKAVGSGDCATHKDLDLHRGRPWRWVVSDRRFCCIRQDDLTREEQALVYDWLGRNGYLYDDYYYA